MCSLLDYIYLTTEVPTLIEQRAFKIFNNPLLDRIMYTFYRSRQISEFLLIENLEVRLLVAQSSMLSF